MPRYRNLTAQPLKMTFTKHEPIVFAPHGEADVPEALVDLVKARGYRVTPAGLKAETDHAAVERTAKLASDMVKASTSKEYADQFLERIASCQTVAELDALGARFLAVAEGELVTRADYETVRAAGKARALALNEAQRAALERVTDPPAVEPAPVTKPEVAEAPTAAHVDASAPTDPAPADPKAEDAADAKSGGHKSTSKPKARG
jgi:Asp-tRNA(Asn)/Glu-tRNA(Gln) amidotransferase C subunit